MDVRIKLDQFEGPLDLLLHLVEKAEVDIYEISIVEITDQYLKYLIRIGELELEDMPASFWSWQLHLVALKAECLLPQPKKKYRNDASR